MNTFNPNELIKSSLVNANFTGLADGSEMAVTAGNEANLGDDWQSYAPTLTNITEGNGTLTALYLQIGKIVHVRIKFQLGSTSAVGSSGRFSLPVTAKSTAYSTGGIAPSIIGICMIQDSGIEEYFGVCTLYATTAVAPAVINTASTYARQVFLASTVPFTWGTTDIMTLQFSYEAE